MGIDFNTIILALISAVVGGTGTGILNQFWTRKEIERKIKAEASILETQAAQAIKDAEISAAEKSSEVWQRTVTHLQGRVDGLEKEVGTMRENRIAGEKANEDLVKMVAARDATIKILEDEIKKLNGVIGELTGRVLTLEGKLLK